ncbi:hypothetical protein GCM10027570_05440 [Streptomonospora sediminis]
MFERFTPEARQTVVQAQHEARTIGHRRIGTEHLLLGLLTDGNSTGARALHEHGTGIDALRTLVRQEVPPQAAAPDPEPAGVGADAQAEGSPQRRGLLGRLRGATSGHIRFSTAARSSLEQALEACLAGKGGTIHSGHLLLGILRVPESAAGRVLARADIDPAALRATTERLSG